MLACQVVPEQPANEEPANEALGDPCFAMVSRDGMPTQLSSDASEFPCPFIATFVHSLFLRGIFNISERFWIKMGMYPSCIHIRIHQFGSIMQFDGCLPARLYHNNRTMRSLQTRHSGTPFLQWFRQMACLYPMLYHRNRDVPVPMILGAPICINQFNGCLRSGCT